MQALARELRLSNVEFLGAQPYQAMPALYQGAAFTIMPSRWYENGPLVVLESFSHATPVIAARLGAMPEWVQEGQTGFLFTPNDPADLRRAIRTALAQPGQTEALGKHAQQYVQAEHDPALYGRRLEQALQRRIP